MMRGYDEKERKNEEERGAGICMTKGQKRGERTPRKEGDKTKKRLLQQSVAYMIPISLMEGTDSEERRKTEAEEKPKE